MPENKEIPNQNTLFSSNSQSHSPPKPAEPPKGPDAKAPPAADGKKHAEPSKAPDAKAAPTADAKKPTEPPLSLIHISEPTRQISISVGGVWL